MKAERTWASRRVVEGRSPEVLSRPGWWLMPLWTMAMLLGLGILATLAMNLHVYRDGIIVADQWTVANYTRFLFDRYYLGILFTTSVVGVTVVLLTLLLGYLPAYLIARAEHQKALLLALTISPILLPAVIRAFSWTYVLSGSGLVNRLLEPWDVSLSLMHNRVGVIIGLTHVFLPFMIVSLLSAMEQIDTSLEEAAEGLGASRWMVIRRIVLPLSVPGVAAGSLLVLTLTVASYITPAMLGSRRDPVIAETIFDVFYGAGNWPFGTAIAMLVLAYAIGVIVLYMYLLQRGETVERRVRA